MTARNRSNTAALLLAAFAFTGLECSPAYAQEKKPMSQTTSTGSATASANTASQLQVARGTFTVDIKPAGEGAAADGVTLGRMSLNKKFEGDLLGTGAGEMLTALTSVKGSAGYVAIERVTGKLAGRSGSFVFQHTGTMNHGAQQLSITVVPDSGTGELQGIAGTFRIDIRDGKHFYAFEYSLPALTRAGQ